MSELSELIAQRDSIMAEIRAIDSPGEEDINRILQAIKSQRWYFFKNNKYILMDKITGLLWANLNYYNYQDGKRDNFCDIGGYSNWRLPKNDDMKTLAYDKTFPFSTRSTYRIQEKCYWNTDTGRIDLDNFNTFETSGLFLHISPIASSKNHSLCTIPCNPTLIAVNPTYAQDIAPNNHNHSERERLQFTLDLFTRNNLWPIFNDDEITRLYGRMYFDKPSLTAKLQQLTSHIDALQTVRLLSSEFRYTDLLAKYDTHAISSSVIKYFQALQEWTRSLIDMLDSYEREKNDTIRQFGVITLALSKKYTDSPALSRHSVRSAQVFR